MCSLLPVSPVFENIRAISIIDRYLEHPESIAYNRGEPKYYICDLMTRNIDYRVELCPVHDHKDRNASRCA